MPLITILIHLVATNAVSNPPHTDAANAVYKKEQQLELNVAFTITPQSIDNLFCYNTVAIIYIYKDYNCFIIFKPYFKPILHSDLLSDITSIGTVILKVDIIVGI